MMKRQLAAHLVLFMGFLAAAVSLRAASQTLDTNDPSGTSSFNTGGQWPIGEAPSAGIDYFTGPFYMRTPPNANSYGFGGHSLTLQPGTSSGGAPAFDFLYEGTGTTTGKPNIYTINNLTNAGGCIRSEAGGGNLCVIAGSMFVLSNSTIEADQSPFVIAANLSGHATLTNLNPEGQSFGTVTYTGSNAGFNGVLFLGTRATVILGSQRSLPGNPTVFNRGQIVLSSGSTLEDVAGVTLSNSNGGITLKGTSTISPASAGLITTILEPITDNGSGSPLIKGGPGTLTLFASNYFSALELLGTSAGSQLNINHPYAIGIGPFKINGGNNAAIDNNSGDNVTIATANSQIWSNDFTFIGTQSLNMGNGAVSLGGPRTVAVLNGTFAVGPVTDNGSGYGLTKMGPGTLAFNGGGAYTGPTVIGGGTLACSGAGLSSASITIGAGTTLDVSSLNGGLALPPKSILLGSGTVNGSLQDNIDTAIFPGGNATPGTLTVTGDLTFDGAGTVVFDLSDPNTNSGPANDLIVVGGTLDLRGPTTFNITSGGTLAGTYTLITYESLLGNISTITVPDGFVVFNNPKLNAIQLNVTQPLVITQQPTNILNQTAGTNVNICVTAETSTSNALTFQWLKNGNLIPPGDTNYLGAASSCLGISNLQASQGGAFSVMVSDGSNVVVSLPADVTVVGPGITLLAETSAVSNAVPLPSLNQFTIRGVNSNFVKQAGTPNIIPNDPGGSEIWYQWSPSPVAVSSGMVTLSTLGSDFDTTIGAYTSPSPGKLVPVPSAINDDDAAGYLNSLMSFYAVSGTTYYIGVDGFYGAQGNLVLTMLYQPGSDPLPVNVGTPIDIVSSNGATVVLASPWPANNCNWLFNGLLIATNLPSLVISNLSPSNTGAYIASLATPRGLTINSEPILVQINLQQDGSTDANSFIGNKFLNSANDGFMPPGGQGQAIKLGDSSGYSDSQTFSIAHGCVSEPHQPLLCTADVCCANWYTYSAPTAGTLEISTVNAATTFPTIVGVFQAMPLNAYGFPSTLVACGSFQSGLQPSLYIPKVASGQNFCVMVQPQTGASACDSGSYNLSLYFASCDLAITKTASTVNIAWPSACGTNLESAASPKGPWSSVSAAITKGASAYSCTLPVAPGNLFFMLR
ncbi:MAG TPA: hypothetical protein VGO59_09925 [Verrucomicrobiae bacterium]|jgi:autotransporter-associated beta strand protein